MRLPIQKILHKIMCRTNNNTKDSWEKREHIIFDLSCLLLIFLIIFSIPAEKAQAASALKLYNYTTKKQTTYQDKQVKVTLDGKKISVDSTPGILMNGIALVSYKDIFAKSGIKADCVYDNSKGTITISRGGTTIVMTIGSKNAKVNGKTMAMPLAPVKIKFINADVVKILVPSRFVSQTLGYDYTWTSSTSTVAIQSNSKTSATNKSTTNSITSTNSISATTNKTNNKAINSMSLSYDNGTRFDYQGTKGTVLIDGENISLGNMPSIINNNTAMLRAKRVFSDSTIGAEYSYNAAKKSITLSKGGKVLSMTIGDTIAYLNGTAITLSRAPMVVYNHDAKASYVMVPGKNTANSLGYDYVWDSKTYTSIITTQIVAKTPGNDNNQNKASDQTAPELGDSGVNNTGLILNEYTTTLEAYGKSSGVYTLNEPVNQIYQNGSILLATRDYNNTQPNVEAYMIYANTPFERVTSEQLGQSIRVIAQNKLCMEYSYQIYGLVGNYVNTINTSNNYMDINSIIELNVLPENYSYDISLSEDKMILYVTIYSNSITGMTIGTNNQGDYLTLTGLEPLKPNLIEQNGLLTLELPYTVNGVGNQNTMISGAKHLNLLYSVGNQNSTQIILGLNADSKYTVSQVGNQYTLFFWNGTNSAEGNTLYPTTGQEPNLPPKEEEVDIITDRSIYELIIPRPLGLTRDKITDYDDYFRNRFSIRIAGDHTAFLKQNNIFRNSNIISDISIFLNSNNETEIRITTSKLQGYEYDIDKENIYINIGNPRDIYPNIVVLDPGHGGPANGAQYFNTKEKDLNLRMLYTLGNKYFNSDPSKLKVYYTRITDVDMSLADRAAYAKKMGADLFVSLHMNASTSSAAYGTEVYYSLNNNAPNKAGLTSKTLAQIFVNNLTSGLGTLNRGAKAEKYTVVHKNTVPAVLLELGFMSNKNDFAKLSDPIFQEKAVKIIYETLLQVFVQYPTGR